MLSLSRKEWAWAVYDVAHSAFFTTVVAGFFPVFFKQYWSPGDAVASTASLAYTSSGAALIVAIVAPWLGAWVDRRGLSQRGLGVGSGVAVLCCVLLGLIGPGQASAALIVFGLANIAAALVLSLYDSLLLEVTQPERYHKVSLVGYALGYLGGGVLLALHILMISRPELFGLSGPAAAVKIAFVSVGLWWALFSVPLLMTSLITSFHPKESLRDSLRRTSLWSSAKKIWMCRPLALFLLAYWLYIDGVGTLMRMAIDFGVSLGFETSALMTALLLVQLIGFPATLGFIAISKRLGVKTGIYIALGIYVAVTVGAYMMTTVAHFYALAVGVALAQGGLQALSRSYFGLWIPPGKSAEYFGFFNAFGKFAAVLGPVLFALVVQMSSHRSALLSLLVLFVGGAVIMYVVPQQPPDSQPGEA